MKIWVFQLIVLKFFQIKKAVKLYSGDKPLGLFADRLENNLKKLNSLYAEISELFKNAKIENFEKLPDDLSERAEFAKLFKKFNETLEASKIQGFKWSELEYEFKEPEPKRVVNLNIDENTYNDNQLNGIHSNDNNLDYEIDKLLNKYKYNDNKSAIPLPPCISFITAY